MMTLKKVDRHTSLMPGLTDPASATNFGGAMTVMGYGCMVLWTVIEIDVSMHPAQLFLTRQVTLPPTVLLRSQPPSQPPSTSLTVLLRFQRVRLGNRASKHYCRRTVSLERRQRGGEDAASPPHEVVRAFHLTNSEVPRRGHAAVLNQLLLPYWLEAPLAINLRLSEGATSLLEVVRQDLRN